MKVKRYPKVQYRSVILISKNFTIEQESVKHSPGDLIWRTFLTKHYTWLAFSIAHSPTLRLHGSATSCRNCSWLRFNFCRLPTLVEFFFIIYLFVISTIRNVQKDDAPSEPREINKKIKVLKSVLQVAENIASLSKSNVNQWIKVSEWLQNYHRIIADF